MAESISLSAHFPFLYPAQAVAAIDDYCVGLIGGSVGGYGADGTGFVAPKASALTPPPIVAQFLVN